MGVGAANEIVVPPGKTVVGADSFYKNMNTQLTLTLMLFETGQESKPFPCFNACEKKTPVKGAHQSVFTYSCAH